MQVTEIQIGARIYFECLRTLRNLTQLGPPDPRIGLAGWSPNHDINGVSWASKSEILDQLFWLDFGYIARFPMMIDNVRRLVLAEIDGMRARGKIVDLHSRNDLVSGCLKPQTQSTTASEKVQHTWFDRPVSSKAAELCRNGRWHLHAVPPVSNSRRRASNALGSRVSHSQIV